MNDNGNGRGRPKLNKPPRTGRWQPQIWRPEYEAMVMQSIVGNSNTKIARAFSCTPQHVSNILNTDEAKNIKKAVLAEMRKEALSNAQDTLGAIAHKSLERLYDAVHSDALFEKSPFAVIDRGLRVMEHVGMIRPSKAPDGGGIHVNGGRTVILTASASEQLAKGLDEANEVARLYGTK
jgi:hypothetical protein